MKQKKLEPCSVEGCEKPANRVGHRLCEKHYGRLRRNGNYGLMVRPELAHTAGYVLVYAPNHWLTQRHSSCREYKHRVVYFDNHGVGPFTCHWCGIDVTWDDMHVDHLDDNKKNNDAANLLASCPSCNVKRGHHKMVKKKRMAGRLLTFGDETLCMNEWAKRIGLSSASIAWRLDNGWSVKETLSRPRGKFGPQSKR